MSEYDKYCYRGGFCESQYIKVDDLTELRVLRFAPGGVIPEMSVLIVGGLATVVDSFGEIIRELSRDFTVYFIETRDRATSRINGKVRYDIVTMGEDIALVVRTLQLADKSFALMGYSFGASITAESYRRLNARPACFIFMEPTPEFHYPAWSLFVIRWFGKPFHKILKPVAKWYLRNFYINTLEDNEMAVISGNSLDNADPVKLIETILGIAKYKVWPRLPEIECPAIVVGTSKDRLHVPEDILRMVSSLKECEYIDMETNLRTHSPEMGQTVRRYIKSLYDR